MSCNGQSPFVKICASSAHAAAVPLTLVAKRTLAHLILWVTREQSARE